MTPTSGGPTLAVVLAMIGFIPNLQVFAMTPEVRRMQRYLMKTQPAVQSMIMRHEDENPQSFAHGFAGVCELEVARFYCHMAPYDRFCQTRLETCLRLLPECIEFKSFCKSGDEPCCACAFSRCPLEHEGCNIIAEKCASDDNFFSGFDAIEEVKKEAKLAGRKIRRLNPNPHLPRTCAYDPDLERTSDDRRRLNSTMREKEGGAPANPSFDVEDGSTMKSDNIFQLRLSEEQQHNLSTKKGNPSSESDAPAMYLRNEASKPWRSNEDENDRAPEFTEIYSVI